MAEVKNGQICHIEIPAPNMKKTRKFYQKLFGWKTGPEMGDSYCMFFDGAIGGGFDSTAKPSKKAVAIFISVEDIEKKLKEITKAGGKVTMKKTEIGGGHGFCAYFEDINGNRMGLYSTK